MPPFEELKQTLARLYPAREAQTIARWFWEDAFHRPHNAPLNLTELEALEQYKTRLAAHEPWQYVLGQADFYGLKWKVSPAVLIPRPETEELVYWLNEELPPTGRLLDVGTGSGCIAVMLQRLRPDWEVHALDLSAEALEIAQHNAAKHAPKVHFQQANFLTQPPQPAQAWDCIVSNPPYIPEQDRAQMRRNVLDYEPELALFVPNGKALLFYEAICEYALQQLAPQGRVYLELHEGKGAEVAELFKKAGFHTELKEDLSGRCRMMRAWPS